MYRVPESAKNVLSFAVIRLKNFQFPGKTPISRDPLLPSIAAFSNDLKGVVVRNFSRGKPPDPRFPFFIGTSPQLPQYEFRSDGPGILQYLNV